MENMINLESFADGALASQVDKLLEAIPRQILLDNDDLKEISKKLGVLSIKIGGIKMTLEGVIKHE